MAIYSSASNQNLTTTSTPLFANSTSALTSTVTSASVLVLDSESNQTQLFTGTSAQIVNLPDPATLHLGQSYRFINKSSNVVSVNTVGNADTVQQMAADTSLLVICIAASGSTAAAWQAYYNPLAPFTFPLAVTLGGTGLSSTTQYQLLYSSAANTIAGLPTANNGLLVTNGSGVPSIGNSIGASISVTGSVAATTGVYVGSSTQITLPLSNTNNLVQVYDGATNLNSWQTIGTFRATSGSGGLAFLKSRATTVGAHTAVQSGDFLGSNLWLGDDGTNYVVSAQILGDVGGAVSTGIVPGRLTFYTANSSGALTQAMQISSAQVVTLANPLPVASGGTGITALGTGVATALGIATNNASGGLATNINGTFTPTITCVTPGDLSVAYTDQTGIYRRVGNLVYVTIKISFTPTYTTASGIISIAGLPVTAATTTNPGSFNCKSLSSFPWGAGISQISFATASASTSVFIYGSGSSTASKLFLITEFTSGVAQEFQLSGAYAV